MNTEETIKFYDENSSQYCKNTFLVDMTDLYNRFLRHLPEGASILDAGCGSGRDSLAFKNLGYEVYALDASDKIVEVCRKNTGIEATVRSFDDIYESSEYDAVWACASLLHVSHTTLPSVLEKIKVSLKPSGYLYASFRYGKESRISKDGRYFNDMDESKIRKLVDQVKGFEIVDMWTSEGEGKYHGIGTWLNVILKKSL